LVPSVPVANGESFVNGGGPAKLPARAKLIVATKNSREKAAFILPDSNRQPHFAWQEESGERRNDTTNPAPKETFEL